MFKDNVLNLQQFVSRCLSYLDILPCGGLFTGIDVNIFLEKQTHVDGDEYDNSVVLPSSSFSIEGKEIPLVPECSQVLSTETTALPELENDLKDFFYTEGYMNKDLQQRHLDDLQSIITWLESPMPSPTGMIAPRTNDGNRSTFQVRLRRPRSQQMSQPH